MLISNLISVYGDMPSLVSVPDFLDWFFAETRSFPLFASGKNGRFGSYRRIKPKIPALRSVTIKASRKQSESMENCEFELAFGRAMDSGPCMVLQFPIDAIADLNGMMGRLRHVCTILDYGFLMHSRNSVDDGWYALGMVMFKRYGLQSSEANDIGLWDEEEHRKFSRFSGRLRDVYHCNYIGPSYPDLIRCIVEWNASNGQQLIIDKVDDVFVFWATSFSARQALRAYLRTQGMMVCRQPFPGDGPALQTEFTGPFSADRLPAEAK
jgi:hypothetical protein